MFPKKLLSIGIILIVGCTLAGSMFRIGSIEQFISLAEPLVERKSSTLGWTTQFRKLSKQFGPEVEIVNETFNNGESKLTFRNGNSLSLSHILWKGKVFRSAGLYSRQSDQDFDTMAQIALLVCATTNKKDVYREVCHQVIGEASGCMFGRPGKAIHASRLQKEGLIYCAWLSKGTANFGIYQTPDLCYDPDYIRTRMNIPGPNLEYRSMPPKHLPNDELR